MFESHATLVLLGFAAIYIASHFAVMKLPYFAQYSQLKKSFLVKVIALVVFIPIALLLAR